ncbi:SpoIIE family protein phosphatase [Kitasatospora sp. NPDC058190]|uniref:SpoIIE family protein phosphatase n=1 Tax=Kitasatospora sp. NPDC058190 TaxID=3346371 RepID=UPI0036D75C99
MGSAAQGAEGRKPADTVLAALFPGPSFGLVVLDTELRVVKVDAPASEDPDFPGESLVGRRPWELVPGLDAGRTERMLREVLETGQPRKDVLLTARSTIPPHRELALSASTFRLQDAGGRVLGLAVSVIDVSEQHRARRQLELLEGARSRLGTTLDVFRTAQELAELAVPELADVVTVDVLDSVLRGEARAVGPVLEDLPMRRAARHGMPSGNRPLVEVGKMISIPYGTPYSQCLADLQPRLVRDLRADVDWLAQLNAGQVEWLRRTGVHSVLVVPLAARGVVMGLAAFYRTSTPAPFDELDLALAANLAAPTAVCLDNARLYTREHSAARLLQLTLRPPQVAPHLAVETARSYQPVGSGGDWFDVILLSGERVALVAGDTAEEGLEAAATMAEVRAAVCALAAMDLPPDEVLERLHALVIRRDEERLRPHQDVSPGSARQPDTLPRRTANTTCLYAVYDPVSRHCTMASAGHPAPAVAYPDGTVALASVPTGPPLGLGITRYESTDVELPEGTVLALCNAGLLQSGDPAHPEEPERLLQAMNVNGATLQDRCDAVFRTLSPQRPRGDAVLLLARTRAFGPDRAATWTWPRDPAAVADARAAVSRRLAEWGLAALHDTTALVVSELATNAIRYAKGPFSVCLVRGEQALTCEVTDDSSTAPQLRHAEDDDEGGRGLFITSQITSGWGVRPIACGKTIWAEQPLPGPDGKDAEAGPD